MTRLVLDHSCRVIDGGRALLGGSPLKLFRLTPTGSRIVEQLRTGKDLEPGHAPLTDRLLDAGAAHPVPRLGDGPGVDAVTLVIPARDVAAELLAGLVAATGAAHSLVVDDGSSPPIGPVAGAEVIRLPTNQGPAAARNTGLDHVTTPLVAFLDGDTEPGAGWLDAVLPHFADDRVGAVAPRIGSTPGDGLIARYEHWRSPLDLGPDPARVRAGTRVSYVPAAALVARRRALADVGGFDPDLRYGEDVDLVWRLDAARWRVRYEPRAVVHHAPRSHFAGWVGQRFVYGSAAAPLERRHPGAPAPARMNRWTAVAWATAVVCPPVGLGVAAATTAALARKLHGTDQPWRLAGRLAGLGHLHAWRILAASIARAWFPFAVAAALVSRRARRIVAAGLFVPPVLEWLRDEPDIGLVPAVSMRIVDDLAYGAGVWSGVLRERSLAAVRPQLSAD